MSSPNCWTTRPRRGCGRFQIAFRLRIDHPPHQRVGHRLLGGVLVFADRHGHRQESLLVHLFDLHDVRPAQSAVVIDDSIVGSGAVTPAVTSATSDSASSCAVDSTRAARAVGSRPAPIRPARPTTHRESRSPGSPPAVSCRSASSAPHAARRGYVGTLAGPQVQGSCCSSSVDNRSLTLAMPVRLRRLTTTNSR